MKILETNAFGVESDQVIIGKKETESSPENFKAPKMVKTRS
jgi:hypothetical protein